MNNDYYRERIYDLLEEGHDLSDREGALQKAFEWPGGERIPVGILYRDESVPAYEEQEPVLMVEPLVSQPIHVRPVEEYRQLLEELI